MRVFAADIQDAFGTVNPPKGMDFGAADPVAGFGNLIGFGIQLFIAVAGMFLLLYLLWGAYDWIASGGEKEKITKAQQKITHALIGFTLIFVAIVIFNVLAGRILKIITPNPDGSGWQLNLPTL